MHGLSGKFDSVSVGLRVKPITLSVRLFCQACAVCLASLSVYVLIFMSSLSVCQACLSSLSACLLSLSVCPSSLSICQACPSSLSACRSSLSVYLSSLAALQACLFICVSACGVCQSTVCQACLSRLTVCQAWLSCRLVCLSVCLPVVSVSRQSVKPVCHLSSLSVLQACLFICVSACGVCQSLGGSDSKGAEQKAHKTTFELVVKI